MGTYSQGRCEELWEALCEELLLGKTSVKWNILSRFFLLHPPFTYSGFSQ